MDTTRDILLQDFLLNDASIRDNIDVETGIGKGITGSIIDSWDMSDVDIIQFLEKRSQAQGMDAGDVFMGARRLRTAGTLYGKTRALLFDAYWDLRRVLNPVLAQRVSPADKGYLPIYFSVPTNRQGVDEYPSGAIDLQAYVLPRASQVVWQRDQQGGDDGDALAIPWQATFVMKDPLIYGATPQETAFTTSTSGNLINRGTFIAPLNIILAVGAASGSVVITAGGVTLTITIPASTGNRVIRYKGVDKLLTVEENSVDDTRMDLLSYSAANSYPAIEPGTSPYSITVSGVTPTSGTMLWFWEAYA